MKIVRVTLAKNSTTAVATVLLLIIGFIAGATPQIREPIIEEAQEVDTSKFEDVGQTAGEIYMNNAFIATLCTVGGTIVIPTLYYGVFGVGAVYGALASYMHPTDFLITLASFGFIELLALFFSILGGLLFPKYVISKILGYPADLRETAFQSLLLLIVAGGILVPAAIVEAALLYAFYFAPSLLLGVLGMGFLVTLLLLYFLLLRD